MTTNMSRLALASILALLAFTNVASAQRGRGGGMVGRGGGGGFSRPQNFNQNVSRPQNFNQNVNRPQNFNQNVNRPQNFNQNVNRPQNFNQNVNRPTNINQNINRPTNINQNVNRPTNINQNINRPTNINNNNINRPINSNNTNNIVNNRQNVVNNVNINNVTNNRVNNNVNNFNRGYGGYGVGYGGAGGYRGWGGYGGYGGGYHGNTYYGYHSNWVNGSWGGAAYRPGWGGYPGYGYGGYYGYNNVGLNALGIGAGIGVAAWGLGSLFNNWGYSSYSNPYYSSLYGQQAPALVAQSTGYDYSRPLDLASAPPDEPVLQTTEASLDSARQAFRAGDYVQALALADQSLTQTPNDPMLHEFRATCLFAQRRYDEAAVPFYTVLSAGPGWDWTTLIGLYPDVETYTSQLRALEAYCNANARAASARFVLAALYLTQGSTAAAATRLREVAALQPQDKLSAQLLAAVTAGDAQPAQVASQAQPAQPQEQPPANPAQVQGAQAAPEAPPLPTGPVPANLIGSWTASPVKDVTISLTIGNDKSFTWKVLEKGQSREFKGEAGFDNDVLALVPPDMPPMVAKVTTKDPAHFNFKAVASPADDPGLNFGK